MIEDLAKKGMDVKRLSKLLEQINNQPSWRGISDKCVNYYDDKQIDPEVAAIKKARGQPTNINNLIRPAIDAVLGTEAQTRSDWLVKADDDEHSEVGVALNREHNEAMRITEANRHISDAYASQIKAGLGWVEVNRSGSVFDYKYRINTVHRNEIYWDWHADPDLKNARWLIRKRWYEIDQAVATFPEHEEIIRMANSKWNGFFDKETESYPEQLVAAFDEYDIGCIDDDEWLDEENERVCVYECWYRKWELKEVIKFGGNVAVLNLENPIHLSLVTSGQAQIERASFPVMRLAYFVGCHRIVDIPSPLPHDKFPYVPFWGYREDLNKVPYGLVRAMLSPQDEANHRRSKLSSSLNSFNMFVESDSLANMNPEQALNEAYRADSLYVTKKGANRPIIEREQSIAAQQYQIMQDDQEMIGRVAGIQNAFMGHESHASSGVAINSLVEQSATTLAEINDNYRYSRRAVGELMLDFIVDDMKELVNHEVKIEGTSTTASKVIVLNKPSAEYDLIDNDVATTKTKVVLDDIQSSAGYRAQNEKLLADIFQSAPDAAKPALLPHWLNTTNHPKREEITRDVMKALGGHIDPENMSEEEREAMAAQQEEQQRQKEIEDKMQQVMLLKADLELEEMHENVRAKEIKNEDAEERQELLAIEKQKAILDNKKKQAEIKSLIHDIALMRNTTTGKQNIINHM